MKRLLSLSGLAFAIALAVAYYESDSGYIEGLLVVLKTVLPLP